MKLYVWNKPYQVSYGGTCAYAVAESEEAARELVRSAPISEYGFGPRKSASQDLDIDRPADRVISLPCAEIYHWQE